MSHVQKGTLYYSEQITQHGKLVAYYRRPGFPRIRLNAKPLSPAMDRAYFAAKTQTDKLAADKEAGVVSDPGRPMTICKPTTNPEYVRRFGDTAVPGVERSLRWAVGRYEGSLTFKALGRHTRDCYRINLARVVAMRTEDGSSAYGEWDIDTMQQQHVEAIQRQLKHKPATADGTVKHLRTMFNWLKKEKLYAGDNPASGITWLHPYNDENEGWATWERDDIANFMHTHPLGTAAHTALGLIIYAGCRITDVALLSRFNEKKNGTELFWIESKGRDSTAEGKHRPRNKPRPLVIAPELRTILDAAAANNPNARAYVTQDNGEPYTRGSMQKVFKRWCGEAGLADNLAAHGLRKASAAMIYGATGNEATLCAVFGWKIGSSMAALYARKFDKQRAQASAFSGLRHAMTGAA